MRKHQWLKTVGALSRYFNTSIEYFLNIPLWQLQIWAMIAEELAREEAEAIKRR